MNGFTTLHVALEYAAPLDIVETLVSKSTEEEIGVTTKEGATVFHCAMKHGASPGALLALFAKANQALVNQPCALQRRTPLAVAILIGAPALVIEIMLKRGADPNIADLLGFMPLHLAMQCGASHTTVATLLRHARQPQLGAMTAAGHTPLLLGIKFGASPATLDLLIQSGADVNQASGAPDRATPLVLALHVAAPAPVIATLLAARANTKVKFYNRALQKEESVVNVAKRCALTPDVMTMLAEAIAPNIPPHRKAKANVPEFFTPRR